MFFWWALRETGKTLIAKAVAGEADVQFLSISGSDFVGCMWASAPVGYATSLPRRKKVAPAIIFIDEIDAVGRKRGAASAAATTNASRPSISFW